MSGMLADFETMDEPAATGEVVPIVAQLLHRASAALGADVQVARREIQRALALLSGTDLKTERATDPASRPGQALAPWQARRVLDHIHVNLDTPVRVEDMAAVTRLSTSYFFRAFKRSFGVSPHAYVIAIRLGRARRMLVEGDEPISSIAAACGFADQAHFSRVFRRQAGSAPGVWRREQRGHEGTAATR